MRDLLTDPACRPEDLGLPLPDDPHAVSVAMPLWEHVVGYEEGDTKVIDQFQCGYPRFFVHPLVAQLNERVRQELATGEERALLFPTEIAAQRCRRYIEKKTGLKARVEPTSGGMRAVLVDPSGWEAAFKYWRFCGEIISSRRAEAALQDQFPSLDSQSRAKRILRERLAELSGQSPDDVYLFPSGIAAVFAVQRVICQLWPGRHTAQLEFPYVDALKVQEEFSCGVDFLPNVEQGGVPAIRKLLQTSPPGAVFCELPSNPQLRTVDLAGLRDLLQPEGIPIVVDDTIATVYNIDAYPYADLVTTSLTKFFSATGNVLAGSVILSQSSPRYAELKRLLDEQYEDQFWDADAEVLERNSRGFTERMPQINANAEAVFDYLKGHPAVEQIWYPKNQTRELYEALLRPEGGYSGLFSLLLKDPARTARPFYDQLQVSKGPSLGTDFTLACPYMLLAHYPELDWSDSLGIDRHLLRFSVGLEPVEELIRRLEEALGDL